VRLEQSGGQKSIGDYEKVMNKLFFSQIHSFSCLPTSDVIAFRKRGDKGKMTYLRLGINPS
jgi:hypothetical protein